MFKFKFKFKFKIFIRPEAKIKKSKHQQNHISSKTSKENKEKNERWQKRPVGQYGDGALSRNGVQTRLVKRAGSCGVCC